MSELDSMFAGGGDYAPSVKFAQVGDSVSGEILSVAQQDQRDINDNTQLLYDRNGNVKKQLQVIIQTGLKDWAGVARIPTDPDSKQPLPADRDDGRRAIYVKGWMIGAVGAAVEKATGSRGAPRVGGKLAVRYSGTRDTGKPQPLKLYEAVYQAPANVAQDGMFAEQAQQAPAQQAPAQQAPAQQAPADPWQAPPAAQQAPAQQAPADPWANAGGQAPPF